jgi:sterol desaturase/sphingolipid hydroxylase (fatty acid hydroxylase superfamily)
MLWEFHKAHHSIEELDPPSRLVARPPTSTSEPRSVTRRTD